MGNFWTTWVAFYSIIWSHWPQSCERQKDKSAKTDVAEEREREKGLKKKEMESVRDEEREREREREREKGRLNREKEDDNTKERRCHNGEYKVQYIILYSLKRERERERTIQTKKRSHLDCV